MAIRRDLAPNPDRQVFHSRRAEVGHFVEEMMVEARARLFDRTFQNAEIEDHAGLRIGLAADHHFSAIGMAVNALARVTHCLDIRTSMQSMRGFKSELFADFQHYGIPTSLCICTLNRQLGCAKQ